MEDRLKVAILGPGNIGSDLMYKVMRSPKLDLRLLAGIIPSSEGLKRARKMGVATTAEGIGPILDDQAIQVVFDCTGANHHLIHAPLLKKASKIAIDLTPAAVGPYVVPAVNMDSNLDSENINLVTCGGQATIPIVAAINNVQRVAYGEVIATISSKSAGPGTRQNIDEFTKTTAKGIEVVGGARKGKAIIILNPADPPIMMRDTIFCELDDVGNTVAIKRSVENMVNKVKTYVPGYRLKMPPLIEGKKVTVMVEVEGAGDFLPKYSGNFDIINAAAVAIAECLAEHMLTGRRGEAAHG